MSSPTRPPDPLTPRERDVLAAIAAHEHRADAAFGNRMARGRPPVRHRVGVVLAVSGAIAVLGTALLTLPGPATMAVVAVAVLAVVPPVLVVWAARQDR